MSSQQNVPENANEGCVGPSSEKAGKASGCAGCPNQGACSSGAMKDKMNAKQKQINLIREQLAGVKNIIVVMSGKGGVGKSSVSSQLAYALANHDDNVQVGVLDVDICGPSMPRMFGVENEDVHRSSLGWSPVDVPDHSNLAVMSVGFMLPKKTDAVIWRGPRKDALISQFFTDVSWGSELDYLIIDTPPGTGDEQITLAQLLSGVDFGPHGGVLLVTTPQEVALLDVRKQVSFCRKVGLPIIGVVENMAHFECPHCHKCTNVFPPSTGGAAGMVKEMKLTGEPDKDQKDNDPNNPKDQDSNTSTQEQKNTTSNPNGNDPKKAQVGGVLGRIPLDPFILTACEAGKSVVAKFPKSAGAKEFANLAQTIMNLKCSSE